MTEIEKAIDLLQQCQAIHTSNDALEYLSSRFPRYRLLSLYYSFFESLFQTSQASPYPAIDSENINYTAKEWEFLSLVDSTLFPLPYLDYYEDIIEPQWIYITPLGLGWIDELGENGFEHLTPGWQALLPLTETGRAYLEHYEIWGQQWYSQLLKTSISIEQIANPRVINYSQLRQTCHSKGNPFRFFPLTLKLLNLSTGNIWLDETGNWTYDYYGTALLWSKENVQYLTGKFHQTQRILQITETFITWLEADLNTRFNELLQLWNTHVTLLNSQR